MRLQVVSVEFDCEELRITSTGFIASMAGLEKPLICVDPVREMLDIGIRNNIANIETICETAEQFSEREIHYDKLLIKGAIHHFPINKLTKIFSGLSNQLSKGGLILIEKTKEQGQSYPTFQKARHLHSLSEEGRSELLLDIFQTLGYEVTTKIVEARARMTKAEAIRNIRNRYTSTLELLTDQEIQEGIEEVEENLPDIIEYEYKREIIIARKC